jgi:hypothetical protein
MSLRVTARVGSINRRQETQVRRVFVRASPGRGNSCVEIEIEIKGKLGKLSFLPYHQNASYKYARGEHIDLHYSHPPPTSPLLNILPFIIAEQRAGNKRPVQKLEASSTIPSVSPSIIFYLCFSAGYC